MLIEFSVANFFSFKNKNTFSMLASSDNLLKDNYINIKNDKILKMTAIYGANASGKSNLFKILALVSQMIRNSNFLTPDMVLPIIPFKLDKKSSNKTSEFEIKFIVNKTRYLYGFKADKNNIYEEYLINYPNGRPVNIFKRSNINEYSFANDKKFLKDIKDKNTNNKFFLSTATNWNYDKVIPAYNFLTDKLGVVLNFEQLKNYSYNRYFDDENKNLEKFALKFLKEADFNVTGYSIVKENLNEDTYKSLPNLIKNFVPSNAEFYKVNTKHIIQNKEFEFDISEESLGTQIIFSFIPVIKDVLDNGKVLIIDEFDRSLHPFIVKYLVNFFNNSNINKKGAQLIFNTNDTNLLNLDILRRDQIWFTEKNYKDGSSEIYPLDDFSVRNTENIERGYLLGRYGAIPFLTFNYEKFME